VFRLDDVVTNVTVRHRTAATRDHHIAVTVAASGREWLIAREVPDLPCTPTVAVSSQNVRDRAGDTWDSVGRAVATSRAVRSTKGGMETSMPTAEEQWRVEAFDAVRGQRQWTCVTASISPDGARLCALYERPFSGIRCEVVLERDRFGSRPERYAEIRRRLHIRTSGGAGEPAA